MPLGTHLLYALSDMIEHRVELRFRLAFTLPAGGLGMDELPLAFCAAS